MYQNPRGISGKTRKDEVDLNEIGRASEERE
jgi:hypothetical protein